jgi:LysM repeat protein
MHDQLDNELDFWGEPAQPASPPRPAPRRTPRPPAAQRPAREPGSSWFADLDPTVKRIGIMVLVAALLTPLALAMRNDEPQLRSVPDPVATVPAVSVTPQGAPAVAPMGEGVGGASGAAPAPALVAPVSHRPRTCSTGYRVRPGDFWIRIAQLHRLTLRQLLAANNARTTTPIYPGRTVCLPPGVQPVSAPQPAAKAPSTTPKSSAPATTTPKPSAAVAPPTTAAPARTYTRDEVIAIIREVWPDELEERAIQIAVRESTLVPTARNRCCLGLFQLYYEVHKSWLASIGVTSANQLFDPKVNAVAALTLYNRAGGWGPWT